MTMRRVKAARKRKQCDWCNEWIEVGQPKVYYFDYDEKVGAHLHPECHVAVFRADLAWDDELPPPGTYRRGCWCGEAPEHCHCADSKEAS